MNGFTNGLLFIIILILFFWCNAYMDLQSQKIEAIYLRPPIIQRSIFFDMAINPMQAKLNRDDLSELALQIYRLSLVERFK